MAESRASGRRWYVALTKPRGEALAREHLERQGYLTALPGFQRAGQRWQPLFPRYIFVAPATPEQSIAPIRSTIGVASLVRFGVTPASVGDDVIHELAGLAQELQDMPTSVAKGMVAGERVRFVSGALKGLEGLVTANADQRVMILLEILGREVEVSADFKDLQLSR